VGKLVILKGGVVMEAIVLDRDEYSIGRDSSSDICLDDPSVSRRHVQLSRSNGQYFVEDQGSTNGTYLNRKRITNHILQDGDLMHIGHYAMRYERSSGEVVEADLEEEGDVEVCRSSEEIGIAPKSANLFFLSGPHKDENKVIDGSLYTIGQPGGDVAVIARRPQGFFLLHIGGNSYPGINGEQITSTHGIQLEEGDIVSVGSIEAEISFF